MQSRLHVLNGSRSTPIDRPSLRESTGPKRYSIFQVLSAISWVSLHALDITLSLKQSLKDSGINKKGMDNDNLAELIRKLGNSNDYFERQKAAWALVGLGEAAVDALTIALLTGEFSDLRYKAAWALGKIGSPRAIEPLGNAILNDSDFVVREWSAAALESVRNPLAVPYLTKAVKSDSNKDVRLRAAVALRNLGAADALMDLLKSPEPEIRGMAITGLAKIKHSAAHDDVAPFIKDEDVEVRRRTTAFMGECASNRSLYILDKALKDSDPVVRAEALKSLAQIKGENACNLAATALNDEDYGVRLNAVTALGEIGHSSVVDRLVEIMFGGDEEEIRAWSAWSLGEIGDERAIEHLRKAYKTCPMEVMKKAKDSLVEVFKQEP